jgi:hypothetical protein
LEQTPQAGMHAQNEHHHSRNGAHGRLTSPEEKRGPNPSPTVNRSLEESTSVEDEFASTQE